MAVSYRSWNDGDDLRLLEVLPAPEADPVIALRALMGPDTDEPAWSRTVVATDDDVVVGAGAVQLNPLHPSRLWAFVEVGSANRGDGVGQALAARLREAGEQSHPGLPLRTKVGPGTTGESFAQAQGMVPVMTHRHVVVAPGAIPPQPIGEGDSATESVEDLATGSVELTRAVGEFYRAANAWDPPADLTLGQVNKQFLSDSAQAYGAIVLRRGVDRGAGVRGSIGAFAISYRSLELDAERAEADPERLAELDNLPTDVLIGWDPTLSDEEAAVAVAKLMGLLVARYPIRVEVTDAMRPLAVVCAQLVAEGTAKVIDEAVTYADPT
ncbi:N-acetyltransferase [Kocuria soli]|uniref:N-acetyltransferase n=1 Tax=Kocuria soli TaxID=2485125 RepID=A0A3N3ZQC8_9MICC|nr:N-acetyltransferase [Kocuria soli]ROZ63350.1 N-acetyltransferase [Kocuria soli]